MGMLETFWKSAFNIKVIKVRTCFFKKYVVFLMTKTIRTYTSI